MKIIKTILKTMIAALIIPLIQCMASIAIFMYQGGYGGGDGSFDHYLMIFQLPGTLIYFFRFFELFWINDFFGIVILPFIVNIAVYFLLIILIGICVKSLKYFFSKK